MLKTSLYTTFNSCFTRFKDLGKENDKLNGHLFSQLTNIFTNNPGAILPNYRSDNNDPNGSQRPDH